MSSKILVTGATGATGREVTQLLLAKGHQVKVLVHRENERSAKLSEQGAQVVIGDFLDFYAVSQALNGMDGAYFVYPIQPGVVQATAYFAQAALEGGVKTIVNMSQINAHRDAVSNASRDHWIAQGIFDRTKIAVTHIRPTFFAEWYLYLAHTIKDGALRLPLFQDGRHAPVAAEDMAKVIASILHSPQGHGGKCYELVGPEAYDQLQIAEIISRVIGRNVTFEQVPESVYLRDIVEGGVYSANVPESKDAQILGDFLIQHLIGAKVEHQQGLLAATNDVVEKIGGVKPLGLEEFLTKHKASFQ